MKILKHTNRTLHEVGKLLRKGLQDELKAQKHNATGALSRGLKYQVIKTGLSVLNVTSSVAYWKAVNNPSFAKTPNIGAIIKWMSVKNIKGSPAAIVRKLKSYYGKPYVVWTEGNKLRRTDFAGYTARKYKDEVVNKLAPSIGVDVANMISEQIRKNNPKARVTEAF
jgi:hypothetical protein